MLFGHSILVFLDDPLLLHPATELLRRVLRKFGSEPISIVLPFEPDFLVISRRIDAEWFSDVIYREISEHMVVMGGTLFDNPEFSESQISLLRDFADFEFSLEQVRRSTFSHPG